MFRLSEAHCQGVKSLLDKNVHKYMLAYDYSDNNAKLSNVSDVKVVKYPIDIGQGSKFLKYLHKFVAAGIAQSV